MLNITCDDLRKKSDRQLSNLFNSLNREIAAQPSGSPEHALATSLLAMIVREQSLRSCRP